MSRAIFPDGAGATAPLVLDAYGLGAYRLKAEEPDRIAALCACGCPAGLHMPDVDGAGLVGSAERGPCTGCGCARFRP